jgi:hypothetical protein
MEEILMRNLILAGMATGLLLSLAGAAQAENPNVPSYSPYALIGPDDSAWAAPPAMAPAMREHRASFVDNGPVNAANGNVPSYSPYAIMPQAQ